MTILYQFLTRDEDIYLTRTAGEIISHYGPGAQLIKLQEECCELVAAIVRCSLKPGDEHEAQFYEELADVTLMIEQIIGSMDAKQGRRLAEIVMAKANRQLRRMAEEDDKAAARDMAHGC